jgi:hypothetical protein
VSKVRSYQIPVGLDWLTQQHLAVLVALQQQPQPQPEPEPEHYQPEHGGYYSYL